MAGAPMTLAMQDGVQSAILIRNLHGTPHAYRSLETTVEMR